MNYRPFPTDALPSPLREYVESSAHAIGCDPAYVALPLLSATAGAIGATCTIGLKGRWTEPAIIWAAIVGESGTHKSPAMDAALAFTRAEQHEAMRDHREALRAHAESESDGPAPKPARYFTTDTTTEALAGLLSDNPRGLLVAVDELCGWLGGFDRYNKGGGDAPRWLELFGGRALLIDRKSSGTIYVARAVVSVCGSIQPGALRRALGVARIEDGMAARLLYAMPPRRRKRWTEAEPDLVASQQLGQVFGRLFRLRGETNPKGDDDPLQHWLSDDGKRAWIAFYNAHAARSENLTGPLAAAASKHEAYCARLALVIHRVRWAAGDPSLAHELAVDAESVNMAARLVEWFAWEAERVYAMLDEGEADTRERELVEWIELRGGVVSVRDLTRGPRQYAKAEAARAALDALVRKGLAVWDHPRPGQQGGAPTERCRLLTADTTPADDAGPGVLSASAPSARDG